MEDKNIEIETVQNEDGTESLVVTDTSAIEEINQTDVIPEEEDDSDGKLGLAVLGLGAAAIAGLTAVVVKKVKNKKAKDATSKEDMKPDEPKKGKRVQVVTKGRKLTLAERIHGCELNPVEPENATAEEDEAE